MQIVGFGEHDMQILVIHGSIKQAALLDFLSVYSRLAGAQALDTSCCVG